MSSSAENPNYHRSALINTFTLPEDPTTPLNDFFGSSYVTLFNHKVKRSTPYIIRQRDRLDLISYRYYGNTSLWWVIAIFNTNIYHPLILNVGDTINIPLKVDVDAFFLANKAGQLNSPNTNIQV
jgi:hypothetical protein